MEQSIFAQWLNETFYAFDSAILGFYHSLAEWGGGFFTPFMKFISLLGEKGLFFILLALTLLFFSKTRKNGFCMLVAIIFGALFTNIILKNTICRIRPFELYESFREFWNFVGAEHAGGFSFPSGHATATTAFMGALVLTANKKWCFLAVPFVILMAASRNYLMVHYPTDVAAGMIVGAVAALCAYGVTSLIFKYLHNRQDLKFCRFALHSDLKNVFLKIKKR